MLRASWIVVAIMLAPSALATWYSYGTYEPDTTLDVPLLMQQNVPGNAHNRVYFNVYTTWGDSSNTGAYANPNVGALHTNVDLAGPIYWEAVFGVWTDCNGDGYVGMLETAIREYDAKLLLSNTICPPQTGPKTSWPAGANNYNGWVTELIPIANKPASNGDKRVYRDDEAMVWGDPGKPDDAIPPAGVQCQGRARGDAHTTGGILWAFDCQGNSGYVRRFNELDAMLGTGLGFGDDPANSGSPLNQPTFGEDSSDHSAVDLQDCDATPILETDDSPPGDDVDNIAILRPVPAQPVNPDINSWSVPGTLNRTTESMPFPDDNAADGARSTSNCDYEDDAGQDFYRFLEGNVDVPPYNGKDAAWRNFAFSTASRGTLPATVYPANGVGASGGSGNAGVPTDLGIEILGIECGPSSCFQSQWLGGADTYLPPTLNTRSDVLGNDVGADVAAAAWFTFYAHAGSLAAKGLVGPGGLGEYGSGQCGENDFGQFNGWNCETDAWYRRADGSHAPPGGGVGVLAAAGQAYEFRDVDCFDGDLGDADVGVSPAFYGNAPCTRP